MSIRTSVGRPGPRNSNAPEDVQQVKELLNMVYPQLNLVENGVMDDATITAIETFQRDVCGMSRPDGIISPNRRTWRALMNATNDRRYYMISQHCVIQPSFAHMQEAYEAYRADNAPCKAGVTNQCAVRMSIAMIRCGLDFQAFGNQSRVHRRRSRCGTTIPHVLGANELARYLRELLGEPRKYDEGLDAETALRGQRGIIYFDNCFTRSGQSAKRGDHIDLWTGTSYYNELIGIGAGGDAGVNARLFRRSDDGVWFWPLPA